MARLYKIFVVLCLCVYALNGVDNVTIPDYKLHLKKDYQVNKSDIYSTDMFPMMDRRFKVATLPPDKFTLTLKSVDIKLIFARYGYEIISFESDYVEFQYVTDMRENNVKEFIEKMYIQHYGNRIHIENLLVRPLNNVPSDYELIQYELPESALKKHNGTLAMKYRTPPNAQMKKLTFIYMIKGTLDVFKSTQNIPVSEIISTSNTRIESVPFERLGTEYMSANELNNSSAKSYIRVNTIITKDKIKPRVIVKKGDKIHVVGYENGISMEVVLEARQNAVYNDIINAKNPSSGKILRVRVTDEGRGELL